MPHHLVSLGSSFAAGPGLHPVSNASAGRSAVNYPSLLAKVLNAKHTDLTVSGSTLLNILSEQQVSNGVVFEPQINDMHSDADIVTLTCGGNDLGYIGGITTDELKSSRLGQGLAWMIGDRLKAPTKMSQDELVERFVAVIDAIQAKAPQSRIFLVEYITLFGPDAQSARDVSMSQERIEYHRQVASELQGAYIRADKDRKGVVLVNIAEESKSHGIGSAEPWVEGWTWKTLMNRMAPFHPNEQGMKAVAGLIEKAYNAA